MESHVGYARVSTRGQTLETQEKLLRQEGCKKIFMEKVSGVQKDRPQLGALLDYVREGDTVVVSKLDRLARSMRHLTKILDDLQARGVHLKVLDMGMDTSTSQGRLMLNILGSIAEFERELLLERQAEGIANAKVKGLYKGRKATAREKADQVMELLGEGLTRQAVAEQLGISVRSIYRIQKDSHNG